MRLQNHYPNQAEKIHQENTDKTNQYFKVIELLKIALISVSRERLLLLASAVLR